MKNMCEIYVQHVGIFIGIYRHIYIDDMKKENPGIVKVTVLCQRSTTGGIKNPDQPFQCIFHS